MDDERTSTTDPDEPMFFHRPVLRSEIIRVFAEVPAGTVIDATLGGGGHAEALLEAHPGLSILGLDRDADALRAASGRLARFGDRVVVVHTRFDRMAEVVRAQGIGTGPGNGVVGVLFDLGVSSPQFDRPDRGFSYRFDAPLDMRMDRTQRRTAADVLNTSAETELVRILREHGDEPNARRIARAIIAARPLATTGELVDVVRSALPAAVQRKKGHPAKRTFQALRIEVNDELAILPGTIDDAIDALEPGGRVAVVSYHSGEDRIAKDRLRTAARGGCTCPTQLPCVCGAEPAVRIVGRAIRPDEAEIAANPRAASARLRVGEKLDTHGHQESA